MRWIQLTALILCQYLTLVCANAQEQSLDVLIPFNKNWEISDRSFATYYRTGKLNLSSSTFFSGEVKDHYKGGKVQMIGHYNETGLKHGPFKFYYPDGQLEREGAFENDEMKGIWSFYTPDGSLWFKANCASNYDITPLYFKDKNGKETVLNGTGRFALDLSLHPDLIWDSSGMRIGFIEGECVNGLKEGLWKYYRTSTTVPDIGKYNSKNLFYEDQYRGGRFISGKMMGITPAEKYDKPIAKTTLYPRKETKIAIFATDFAFGDLEQKKTSLSEFLFKGQKPYRLSKASSFNNNMKDYIECFNAAFHLHTTYSPNSISWQDFSGDSWSFFETMLALSPEETVPKNTEANLDFWVFKDGRVRHMEIESQHLPEGMEKTLRYYFSVLKNLSPKPDVDSARVQLKFSIFNEMAMKDGVKVNVAHAWLSQGDAEPRKTRYKIKDSVVIVPTPAQFPGGTQAWMNYLQSAMRQNMKHAKVQISDPSKVIDVSFVVDQDGHVVDVKCQPTANPEIAELLIKTLKQSPKWTPATVYGNPTRFLYTMPFRFTSTSVTPLTF